MKRQTVLILLCLAVFAAGAVFFLVGWQNRYEWQQAKEHIVGGWTAESERSLEDYLSFGRGIVQFDGAIATVVKECEYDGACSVTLQDGKKVHTGAGLQANAEANVWGTAHHSQLMPGTPVAIRAVQLDDTTFTLQRCRDCYVQPRSGAAQPKLQP